MVQSNDIGKDMDLNDNSDNDILVKEYIALPIKNPHEYPSITPYVELDAPSTNYYGVPPYGSTPLEGASIPSYDPFFGGSSQHYNYASPFPLEFLIGLYSYLDQHLLQAIPRWEMVE
ncbi:hypothetical protein PIB30_027297 [Stylosanthes scabra]|uniref:Uncharacterized protein n=1 Tax=Stylosanthes scabra TaxID=79078 RepID=A0ABU6Y952_9FABA|nr:hypothetical protein [Stylosanthes scabra]